MELSNIVGDVDEFFARYLGKSALYRRGAVAHLESTVTVDDIDHVLTGSVLRTPGVRLAKDGVMIPPERYVSASTYGYAGLGDVVDATKMIQLYRDGATIVLGTANLLLPRLHELCKRVETEVGHPVDANVYVAPPSARAFDVHCDAQDILIVQVHGRKQWELFDERVANPSASTVLSHLGPDAPSSLYELRAGDVLYVPRGMPHLVRTAESSSIHATITINTMTWADVLRDLTDEILRSDDFAGSLPMGPNIAGQVGLMVTKYAEMLSSALMERADADTVHRMIYGRTVFGAGATTGLFREVLLDEPIDPTGLIRLRPGVWPVIDDGSRITVGTRRFRASAEVAEACRHLRSGPMKVSELSPNNALKIANTLVKQGLCVTTS